MDIELNNSKELCKQCGKPIIGRLDKRFCDAYCRNSYNNKTKRKSEQLMSTANRAIRKNRRILKTLSPVGKSTVRREILTAMGYDFSLFTSIFRAKSRAIYYLCYEFGFTPVVDSKGIHKAVIINQQKYMNTWDPWKHLESS